MLMGDPPKMLARQVNILSLARHVVELNVHYGAAFAFAVPSFVLGLTSMLQWHFPRAPRLLPLRS